MNVKKLLKQQKSAVMPSESVKRRIAADCGVGEERVTNAGGGVAVKARSNKIIAACACCCAAAAVTAGAIILLNPSNPSTFPNVIEADFGTVSTATEFYAYSAVSVGNMLDETNMEEMAAAYAYAGTYDASATIPVEISDAEKTTLDKYAVFATGMLGEGKITSTCTNSDRADYEFKLGIGYNDVFGGSADTVLYFNKVADSIKIEGDEEEFAIEGILVKGDVSFPVEGKYETEVDGSETENEIEFIAYTSLDRKSYIKIGYEYETDTGKTESEVVVSVYKNEGLTEKAKIKGETGDENSFKVEIERPTGEQDVNEKINIKFNPFDEDGKKVMYVDAEFNGNKHKLIMQNKPWEQGGGFDFVNRGNANGNPNGNGNFYPPNHDDDWGDNENKNDKEDKDEKDEKDKPNPSQGFPDLEWGVEDFPSLN